ncbi:hypothetical protein SLE2022_124920 [Rubroshorea leprosula]
MPTARKRLILNSVAVSLGCGSCRRPKLMISSFFNPKPKPKSKAGSYRKHTPYHQHYSSSSSSKYDTATSFSPNDDTEAEMDTDPEYCSAKTVGGFGRVGEESVAVEKDSDDPYLDFRHSMLQMILEKEIYSKDDLRELLNCFLQLNSPYYHGVIVRAFTEIWNGVFSAKPSSSSPKLHLGGYSSRDY